MPKKRPLNKKTKSRTPTRQGKRRLWLPIVAGAVILVLGIAALTFFTPRLEGPGAKAGARTLAELAPDVTFATAKGPFRLSEQKGKVVLLYFSFPG